MDNEQFKTLMKENRAKYIPTADDLVYSSFVKLGFDQKKVDYFYKNASYIVKSIRAECWKTYQDHESNFNSEMYNLLIENETYDSKINEEDYTLKEAVIDFTSKYSQHTYDLNLSNTQSRRSRAGKEFELIIELVLIGAKVPFDTQGSVGANVFESSELAKIVDFVSPGANEYRINKRNSALISAKTSLRERWQEVGDEMSRTMAREMFLATLDNKITDNVLDLLETNNIIVVTTKSNKEDTYTHHNVISFEDMLVELNNQFQLWKNYNYTKEEASEKYLRYKKLQDDNVQFPFISKYYGHLMDKFHW